MAASITNISASAPTMTATVGVSGLGPVHVLPLAATRQEADGETGLAATIHELQVRLAVLEQAVAGDSRRTTEPFFEGSRRPEHDGAPGGTESAVTVGHAYGTRQSDTPPRR
ncbi:hypothetical protein NLX86_08480 [Streptomyces sp. A3M-1-3]|uniref:hypothetical protein n=1 Tax=Streptomyces sp. A3M-1-3 TaxID=2962044 RepID=UPI0020B740E3|nr:hypothetical protein [Streptomyces sp. A3M-1-3]MCP3818148.1 hypothetical protein [Streptomyces sp. A3M-1-3]